MNVCHCGDELEVSTSHSVSLRVQEYPAIYAIPLLGTSLKCPSKIHYTDKNIKMLTCPSPSQSVIAASDYIDELKFLK